MSKSLVPTLSDAAVNTILGPPPTLGVVELAVAKRRHEAALGQPLAAMSRPDLLAEVERTMAALENYPRTPGACGTCAECDTDGDGPACDPLAVLLGEDDLALPPLEWAL